MKYSWPNTVFILFALPALLLAFFGTSAGAAAGEVITDEAELAALLSIVEEETELATKSKMNSDFVPGIVTILHGNDLEAQGIRTVWEALSLVPGMQTRLNETRSPGTVVRGIDFAFNSGNIKVLVNSVPVSQEFSGVEVTALNLPIEFVDRIEVIRGPGSSIYGNAAYSGLINVITREETRPVFVRLEEHDAYGAGTLVSWASQKKPVRLTLALSGRQDDQAGLTGTKTGSDDQRFALFSLSYGDFTVQAQGLKRDFSAEYDPNNPPPGPLTPFLNEDLWATQISHRRTWSPLLKTEGSVSFLSQDLSATTSEYKGNSFEGRFDFTWTGWDHQTLLVGLSYGNSRTDEAFRAVPTPPGMPQNHASFSGLNRRLWSVWLQDQIAVTEGLTLTAGLRFDRFSDVADDSIAPRLALVWHAAENHILKAQYAEGFHAPTFWELYADGEHNQELESERIETTELSYTYRRPASVARVTLFDSRLRNMLGPDGRSPAGPVFGNPGYATSRGVEMELARELNDWLKVDANLSYVSTEDFRPLPDYSESPAAADWLGNLSFLAKPMRDLAIGLRWHYVSDRVANIPEAAGYNMVDLTFSWFSLFSSRITLRAGVKNLFDEDSYSLISRPNIIHPLSFSERTIWLQLSFKP
ncbi:MAG: TonB-dependent receptor [bacterium]|nr:TonB-dependent receptor [bacterium]